jgi:DNA repair protein RecN (Recombination protein N)
MLRELRIKDFAIIDDLSVAFVPGLNVLTGETGAGKSIILQALALLCGARSDPDAIRRDAEVASVEGLFAPEGAAEVLGALGFPPDDEIAVRRVVARTGKGRAHVNGSPATVALLAQLGRRLVHIYGQHDQAQLLDPASHLELLDRFAGCEALRARMAAAYAELVAARQRLAELTAGGAARAQRRELLEFQIHELAAAAPQADEEAVLRPERDRLRHAERLRTAGAEIERALYSGDSAVLDTLGRMLGLLRDLSRIDGALEDPTALLDTAVVHLREAADWLRAYVDRLPADAARLEAIEERLALLGKLARKHDCPIGHLPALLQALHTELAALEADGIDATSARAAVESCTATAVAIARELSRTRAATAADLEPQVARELAALGMGAARFTVARAALPADGNGAGALTVTGLDTIEFLLAANPGEGAKPLARIASGGELSRIMLGLKALTAATHETPVLIFDEVDAGIGGAVADAVARRLSRLARARQVLCVTHLPQIAAYADHHLAVEKTRRKGRTITGVRPLRGDARIAELSRMLGGAVAPAEAARYARRLIAEARAPT